MPSKSIAQQHLMQAAEHGASFPMAKKIRKSMSHDQMHDFAVGSEKGKPQHVGLLQGNTNDIMKSNMKSLKNQGKSELDATKIAISTSKTKLTSKKVGHPNRHKNLGNFLHQKGK